MERDTTIRIGSQSNSKDQRIKELEAMLKKILKIEDAAFGLKGFDAKKLKQEIKELL